MDRQGHFGRRARRDEEGRVIAVRDVVRRRCGSEGETVRLASDFAPRLGPGAWVALIGPLGAGKSVFARAIGKALGVSAEMPSPTYTLMAVHRGRLPVYHMDFYRIASEGEVDLAGLEEYFSGDGVCLVEWAERVQALWPPSGWRVTFEVIGPEERAIEIARFGDVGES